MPREHEIVSSTTLCELLAELLHESQTFLAHGDRSVEEWVVYGKKRDALFSHLLEVDWRIAEKEITAVRCLMASILQQEEQLKGELQAKLAALHADLTSVVRLRQALAGRHPAQPPRLLSHRT